MSPAMRSLPTKERIIPTALTIPYLRGLAAMRDTASAEAEQKFLPVIAI